MRTFRGLVQACHPGPTALVTAFATSAGAASGLTATSTATLGVAVLLGQLSVGWSNDWWDARDDLSARRPEKPVVQGLVTATLLRRSAFAALALCVPASLALGWRGGLAHLAAVASAWSYNLWLKTTLLSWAPFALSFGLLPWFVSLPATGHPHPEAAVVAASALFGVAAHLTNGVKDMDADALTGVSGLPQRLGVTWATVLSASCIAVAVAVMATARPSLLTAGLGALAVLLALTAVRRALAGGADRLFELSMAAAAPVVVAVVLTGGVR